MKRTILALVFLILGMGTAFGQITSAPETSEPQQKEPATQQLIDLLKDEAARNALIEQLEATQGKDAAQEIVGEEKALGQQVAETTARIAESVADTLGGLWQSFLVLPQTVSSLGEATDPDILYDALKDLIFVIVVTYGTYLLLRRLSHSLSRRLAQSAAHSTWIRRVWLSILSSLTDLAVVVISWAAGYAITTAFSDGYGVINVRQSLYLNAFLIVMAARVAGRAILAPTYENLRIISLSSHAARILWRWLSVSISILGYGYLLIVNIATTSVGRSAGNAMGMAVGVIVVLLTIALVLRHRAEVAKWFYDVEDTEHRDSFLESLADLWHWPVMIYLLGVLVTVLSRSGDVLLSLLWGSSLIVGTLLLGLAINSALSRSSTRGVRLPFQITKRLPLLEHRLNAFVPKMLAVLRAVLIALVVAVSLNLADLFDLKAWFASDTGDAVVSVLISVSVILFFAFLLWLAITSWIDYRLNPDFGSVPTARETTLLTLLRNAVSIVLLVLVSMVVLSEIGLDIAPLLASAGVLGLAIGFGAQKMVQDIITGIFIQFENAINVGDVVTVAGTTGAVEKLTVRSVSLRDVEGIFHIIPFSSVDMVSNYTRDFSYFLCDMGVAYGEKVQDVKVAMIDAFELLRKDADHEKFILGDLEWFGLQTFGDSAVVLRARIKTTPGKQWGAGRAYNGYLKDVFDERGIEIPYPHRTIQYRVEGNPEAAPSVPADA